MIVIDVIERQENGNQAKRDQKKDQAHTGPSKENRLVRQINGDSLKVVPVFGAIHDHVTLKRNQRNEVNVIKLRFHVKQVGNLVHFSIKSATEMDVEHFASAS
jgi:hypothetical protein